MPRVVYVEPTDEIADLIQRVRDAGDGSVALAVPIDSRVLHTPVNARLLAQFAARENREVAIISGDPRVQGLVRDAKFPTYASVQAFERGIELVQPHPAGVPPAEAALYPPADTAAYYGAPPPLPMPSAPPAAHRPSLAWMRRRPFIFGVLGLLIVGLVVFLAVAPSAQVTVTIAATELSANPTIEGTADPAVAKQGDHILTEVVTADAANRFAALPTGVQTVPPTPATGAVAFSTDLPFGASFAIQKGEGFQTSDNPPVIFYATQDVAVAVPPPLVPGQHGAASNPIPVQDGTPEARGNVAAGAINTWPRNPCNPDPTKPRLCSPSDLTVGNPAPTSGGAAEKKLTVVSDQDLVTFRTQVDNLKKQLGDAVLAAMSAKASGKLFAIDASGNGRSVTADISPPLPKGGVQYSPTTITVTVHGRATVFALDDVRRALVADLSAQVPQGESLATEQLTMTPPKITQAGDDGALVLAETATAFSKPTVTLEGLKSSLAGKSPDDVRKLIQHRIGRQVIRVDVAQKPFSWPLLPFFSSRIELVENFVAAHKPSA